MTKKTPHKGKLIAAINNPKCKDDIPILKESLKGYNHWMEQMKALTSTGKQKVIEMTKLLNDYKNLLEVDLISAKGSNFIKRQKGQLKLDNSILEEFLIYLIDGSILNNLPSFELNVGPQRSFMSLAFKPTDINKLNDKPMVELKLKDQDFALGKTLYYKFSSNPNFIARKTSEGNFYLAVLAAECKVNYDKTMFQECAGTANRLKQGCPIAKYYTLVEYLDMTAEDCRLTEIDNVFILRKTKRLNVKKRNIHENIKNQHLNHPIDGEVVYMFVKEVQAFIDAVWYDPNIALERGSFN